MYDITNCRPIPAGLQNMPSQVGLEAYSMLTPEERALEHSNLDAWFAAFHKHCHTVMARHGLA